MLRKQRKIYTSIFFFLVFFSFSGIYAQDIINETVSLPNFKIAEELFTKNRFFEAISYYEAALKEKKMQNNMELSFHLAECYRNVREYGKAEVLYKTISETALQKYQLSLYWLGMMQKSSEKYTEAITSLKNFLSQTGFSENKEFHENAPLEIKACEEALKLKNNPGNADISILDQTVNKKFSTYAALLNSAGLFFIGSIENTNPNEKLKLPSSKGKYEDTYFNRLYFSEKNGETWNERKMSNLKPLEENMHITSPAFTSDEKELYFAICRYENDKLVSEIYKSSYTDKQFSKPELLWEPINIDGSSSRHPFITSYQDKQILFFISDRQGGQGGFDIYYSISDATGNFTEPVNLGPEINTPLDEYSPFYDFSSGILYFSSQGHNSSGGFDIFSAEGTPASGWKDITNAGFPFNSGADDYYYIHYNSGDNVNFDGFLSSNRPNSGATCCDNIYKFHFTKEKIQDKHFTAIGKVFDESSVSQLPNATVSLYSFKDNKLIQEINTDKDKFEFRLNRDTMYYIQVSSNGYTSSMVMITTPDEDVRDLGNILLKKKEPDVVVVVEETKKPDEKINNKPIDLPIIYFAFTEYSVQNSEKEKLDKLADYLKSNPNIRLTVASNTDNVSSKSFNIMLSRKRTEAVMSYLISKGLAPNRLVPQWYGEENPVTANQTNTGEDNPEGRQKNRRTEFSVITDTKAVKSGQMVSISGGPDTDGYTHEGNTNQNNYSGSKQTSSITNTSKSGMKIDENTFIYLCAKYYNTTKTGLIFRVQVAALKDPAEGTLKELEQQGLFKEDGGRGYTRFLIGNASTMGEANTLRQEMINKSGLSGAFLVPYYNGKRITLVEAVELMGQ